MQKITRIEHLPGAAQKKRVAAYARVSKATDRTIHSLSAQVSYYNDLIQKNSGWEFAGVYADEAIPGGDAKKRTEFQHMIADCENGKIDIILTKSISRFARNTVDLLETVRHLKDIGVEVRFEKENINSMNTDGELMLTILASFAQAEVEAMSESIRWTIHRKFRNGQLNGCVPFYGYRWNDDLKRLIVVPDEAKMVKEIFYMYMDGYSLQNIVNHMEEKDIKPIRGERFDKTTISNILKNITYTGNLLLQKTYSQDPITKKSRWNRGELPQYYSENTHEAIIDMETFETVQQRLALMRVHGNALYYEPRAFSRKLVCGLCGRHYTRVTSKNVKKNNKTYINYYWTCSQRKEKGKAACPAERIPEKKLMKICCDALGWDEFNADDFRAAVDKIIVNGHTLEFYFSDGNRKGITYG